MDYYYEYEFGEQEYGTDREGKMWGGIATLIYILLLIGLMLIPYTFKIPEPAELGVMVDFGIGDTGWGEDDLPLAEMGAVPVTPREQAGSDMRREVVTTNDPDAEPLVQEPRPNAQQSDRTVVQTEPSREVDRRALFPGRTEGSTATSQGTAGGTGNQGVPTGSPGGVQGEGGGTGSSGFSLAGRYLVGSLPRPAYNANEEGRVVIRITVDREGKVTSAIYEQAGSTTNNSELVNAARAAAVKARFTASGSDVQTGTVTYIFRLN